MSGVVIGVDADGWPVYDDADGDLIALINRAQAQSQRGRPPTWPTVRLRDPDGWPLEFPATW